MKQKSDGTEPFVEELVRKELSSQIMDATQIRTIRLALCWIHATCHFFSTKDCRNTARTKDFHFSCHVIERLGSWL